MRIFKTLINFHLFSFISAISIKNTKPLTRCYFPINHNPINHNPINHNLLNHNLLNHNLLNHNQIFHTSSESSDNYLSYMNFELKQFAAEKIVKSMTSSLLPLDKLAPTILKLNESIIKSILDNDFLSLADKKILILNSIQFAINGDLFGSKILELYYDIVNMIL